MDTPTESFVSTREDQGTIAEIAQDIRDSYKPVVDNAHNRVASQRITAFGGERSAAVTKAAEQLKEVDRLMRHLDLIPDEIVAGLLRPVEYAPLDSPFAINSLLVVLGRMFNPNEEERTLSIIDNPDYVIL